MKTTTTAKGTFMRGVNGAYSGALVALAAALAMNIAGCTGGWADDGLQQGDRCNPYASHNQCSDGLACTVSSWQVNNAGTVASNGNIVPALGVGAGPVLAYCPENYCCPVDSNGNLMTSGNANCQPGCNGGAAAACAATADPATCAFADGGAAAVSALEAGMSADGGGTPADASPSREGGGGG